MPFYLEKGDLVSANVDAIVNASNVNLKMVEGVGRAIFHKAGDVELAKACKAIGSCKVGGAVMTPSFNLTNCKAIIHAVGPIYINGKHDEEKNLRKAYESSLQICLDNGFKSVAFPLLSGEFNYPAVDAYEVAQDVFSKFLNEHKDFTIRMIIFKNFPDLLTEDTRLELKNFIIDNFNPAPGEPLVKDNTPFVEIIKSHFDFEANTRKDLVNATNIELNLINKILDDKTFIPSKNLVMSFIVGLKLDEAEATKLLKSLGYVTFFNGVSSMVTLFFLRKNMYDLFRINAALFHYEVNPLGLE